jgi:hypothetical protein
VAVAMTILSGDGGVAARWAGVTGMATFEESVPVSREGRSPPHKKGNAGASP